VGSIVGMGLGDCYGHPFEFIHVADKPTKHYFNIKNNTYTNPLNSFRLKPGQWTDDAAMGLCIADSLIIKKQYDGSHIRVLFWNWWRNGFNNAFRNDEERSSSVGLGGNISNSIRDISNSCWDNPDALPSPRFERNTEDSGNGSLMRLAPIPIFYCYDEAKARDFARESSFTTHPGSIAAEACAFMATVIVRAINRDAAGPPDNVQEWLQNLVDDYKQTVLHPDSVPKGHEKAAKLMIKLLNSDEGRNSKEVGWNWKDKNIQLERTLRNRGETYNGYGVSPGYYGAYSMDGLAVALNCIYHTNNFEDAIERCINFCGDADSTGSICGQMAGAIHGYNSISKPVREILNRWDNGNFALRGAVLLSFALQQSA